MTSLSKFSLATVEVNGLVKAAIVVSDNLYLLDKLEGQHTTQLHNFKYSTTVVGLLSTWKASLEALAVIAEDITNGRSTVSPLTSFTILTPIRCPNKLIAIGGNYYEHLREMDVPARKMEPMPYFFRPPTTSLVGPGPNVREPRSTQQLDWELELVLVLGKTLRHATSLQAASDAIAGYVVGLDLSCRDLQMVKDVGMDVGRGKAQDTLAPCGPFFVPKHNVPQGIGSLALKLWVNNQQKVDANTNDMIFSPEEMLMELSKYMTLEPGDLVSTGAPAGTAEAHGDRWLQVGDQISAEIEGVGVLKVGIVND